MVKQKRRKVVVKLCPRCHSKNIKPSSVFNGWLTPEVYICEDCGYRGPIVLEVELNEENFSDN